MKSASHALVLESGRMVVYPAHGVGRISGIETQEIAGMSLELLVVEFPQTKMTLRLPKAKALSSGLRALASEDMIEKTLAVLGGRAKARKGIWARKAADFEAKIKSGDLLQIAEVVRDLARDDDSSSYSERQIYELAIGRLITEVAEALRITETEALGRIEARLVRERRSMSNAVEEEATEEAA